MSRVLITGITGFVGSHLAERLLQSGDEVHGLAIEEPPYPNLAAIAEHIDIHRADLADGASVRAGVEAARPDIVIHLAGQAIPSLAQRDVAGTIAVNVVGTATVLDAVAGYPGMRLIYASSADVYGEPDRIPVGEDVPLRPTNVYAATKAATEALVREFGDRGYNPTVILRPVNQNGPRQHPGLAASGFAKQIAEVEVGQGDAVIRHGRLDAARDFLDVRDMARAYAAALRLQPDRTETYNVGTGVAVTIDRVLRILVGLARVPVRTQLDPERVRPGDATAVAVDAARFRAATGWTPEIPLERSLSDLLDHWRARVARPVAHP
ncbi:MAG TPA: GDP-mannose 4,6-dehydratase [Candidatus Limnocylindria bacterium]